MFELDFEYIFAVKINHIQLFMKNILLFRKASSLLFWSFAMLFLLVSGKVSGQTFFDMSTSNYTQRFNAITALPTNFSTVAILPTGTIPVATKTTTASTSALAVVGSGAAVGIDAATSTRLVFLTTGGTNNTSAIATDLNLNFSNRNAGDLSFDASTIFNGTGDRVGSLRVYYSTDNTNWAELTGTNLPYVATNNVVGSANVSITLPAALNNQPTVKLRFYYHNGTTGGTAGSRPKIGLDNLSVTSNLEVTQAPGAPTIDTITPGNGQLSVAFTAPSSNGGAAITDYKCSINGGTYFSLATTTSPFVLSTLTNGTAYSITIKAVNSAGDGTASNSVSGTPRTVPSASTIG